VLVFGLADSRFGALIIWAFVLFVVGTVDDKISLNPLTRLVIEAFAAAALWNYGLGWNVFGGDIPNLVLTIVWVVALVNAFNLMDNMDGATATVGAISSAGVAALGLIAGDADLAVLGLAITGACVGFLRYNLTKPRARIFLGDGGSMPIGFLVAGAVMAAPGTQTLGWSAILALTPLVGLPVLDTVLVVISRRRGGRPILSGGRDHLTHRLRAGLGSARMVALALGTAQTGLCMTAILLAQTSLTLVVLMSGGYVVAAGTTIYMLESRFRVRTAQSDHGEYGVVPADPRRVSAGAAAADEAPA
jgi:UDP-GlcNAc:undecaprenyl-phosphate GlcNAc-1-phosphate transferase